MLNPVAAQQQIRMQGERLRWFQALPCDCQDDSDPSYGDYRGCGQCEHGYIYREQAVGGSVRALVTAQKRQFLHPEFGWIAVGDLWLTSRVEELPISKFDKVVLIERAVPKKERVVRGTGLSDALAEAYPVEVVTVADGATEFVEGVDYLFDETEGAVVWIDGGAAPRGQTYAVDYRHAPVYWYVGAMMTEARPMPGARLKWPQRGLLTVKFPEE